MKKRRCHWCGRLTNRICGVCLECCNERDRQIAGGIPYIPPDKRPGHRFYERKIMTPAKQVALAKAMAARNANLTSNRGPGRG